MDRRTKALTVVTVCLALLMAFIDGTVVNLALPTIQHDLDAQLSDLQWVVDGYILALAMFLLMGGALGDRYGRKRLFLFGVTIFVLGSIGCAWAPEVEVLIAGRAVQGFGAALFMPGTLSILSHTFREPRERAAVIGIWSGVSGLALAVGPLVGGALVGYYGWRSIFYINLPIAAVVLVLAVLGVREFADPADSRLDLLGQLLVAAGLVCLTFGVIEGGRSGWSATRVVLLLVAAVALLAAFVGWELRNPAPMLPMSLFRGRTFATCTALVFLVGFGLIGAFFFLSLFLQNVQDYRPLEAGLRLLPAVLAVMATAPFAGRMSARFGPRWFVAAGMTLVGSALLLLNGVQADTSYGQWWPILLLLGAGVGLSQAPTTAAVVASVSPRRTGLASGTATTSQQVGAVFGIALLGTILGDRFADTLRAGATGVGLPPGLREQIASAASAVATPLPPGVDPVAVHRLVGQAFVDGMHSAVTIAGVTYLAGALAAALLLPSTPVEPPADSADERHDVGTAAP